MKRIQLLLTQPCTEQWSDIERADGLHHCGRCEKNILDLTTQSDEELIDFFRHKNDNICGRLLASQLNRALVLPSVKINWHWLMPLAFGAFVVNPSQAQNLKPVVVQNDQASKFPSAPMDLTDTLAPVNIVITGKVVDNLSGNLLVGVKVRRKGYENVLAITDLNGRFEFSTTDKDMLSKFIFSLGGYSSVETNINDKIIVQLIAERKIMLGGISSVSLDRKPLYLVFAGNKNCIIDASRMNEISPDWIENIEVLQDAKATAIYGAKGANGVIKISLKKVFKNKFKFSK
ncbi:hypothetical protein [Pedobacter mendelii]|uniref:TonB-dependent receptor plug domain-containing protein n=1 Tax=Pedobacter mendelii TaxID=1908240 RepID=A0ABQ2BNW4_9SPHI|nr:hypothetical protein [Pedobacter mendelii]GGI29069.1 hypothetical protein GCM10008119_35790 [Pedobacter mendelii]